ncbi:ComEA family DNA-binding protein [Aromatoleum sp.]|uniref:ComEA family DNA-binding protein n=1 Tax=Aromatoleum sp. TaxID=2307007 RepID=UPI002FC90F16
MREYFPRAAISSDLPPGAIDDSAFAPPGRAARYAFAKMLLTFSGRRRENACAIWHSFSGDINVIRLLRSLVFAVALSPLAALATPVDINTADATALEEVKGIGPARAKAIVEYRTANGPFASVDDLTKVSGIGDKSVNQLRDQVTVGAAKKPAAKAKAK